MALTATSLSSGGFTVITAEDGPLVVRYRNPSGWGVAVFPALMVIFSGGFTLGVFLEPDQEDGVALMLVGIFFSILSIVEKWRLLRTTVMTTEFVLAPEWLIVTQHFLGRSRTWQLQRAWLHEVVQIKEVHDEAADEWHLKIQPQGGTPETVLTDYEREASDWLGPVIAQWAGVPFVPVPPQAPPTKGRCRWWRFWEWRWEW